VLGVLGPLEAEMARDLLSVGAVLGAIVEPDRQRAAAAVMNAPGARSFARTEDALDAGAADAVLIATPARSTSQSFTHLRL